MNAITKTFFLSQRYSQLEKRRGNRFGCVPTHPQAVPVCILNEPLVTAIEADTAMSGRGIASGKFEKHFFERAVTYFKYRLRTYLRPHPPQPSQRNNYGCVQICAILSTGRNLKGFH